MTDSRDRLKSAKAAVDLAQARADQQRNLVTRLKQEGREASTAEVQLQVLLQCLEALHDNLNQVKEQAKTLRAQTTRSPQQAEFFPRA